jgi:hypothetical protein
MTESEMDQELRGIFDETWVLAEQLRDEDPALSQRLFRTANRLAEWMAPAD